LLDGATEIARHLRSYDRQQRIDDPSHLATLLAQKRKALGATASGRLTHAVPDITAFLDAAFQRGESITQQTRQLLLLLDDYGAAVLADAVREALAQNTPRATSVAFLLSRCGRGTRAPLPRDLSRAPHLADLSIPSQNLKAYDQLTQTRAEERAAEPLTTPASTTTQPLDLPLQLRQPNLRATAEHLDDILARATRQRLAPLALLEELAARELADHAQRNLERLLAQARLGRFRPIADFDWSWPKQIDRPLIERALSLEFIQAQRNLILLWTNGLGKTMIAKNIAYAAVQAGHRVLFRTASEVLTDLAYASPQLRRRKFNSYARPALLVIDEVGYLAIEGKSYRLRASEQAAAVRQNHQPYVEQ
jgi:hypothetical protein